MAKNKYSYNEFSWYCSGYISEEIAQKELDDILLWFNRTYDPNDWNIVTTVRQGPYGWKAEMQAKLDRRGSEESADG